MNAEPLLIVIARTLAMCRLDSRLRIGEEFLGLCQTVSKGVCCNSWSLPNYVALLNNKTSCMEITVGLFITLFSCFLQCLIISAND